MGNTPLDNNKLHTFLLNRFLCVATSKEFCVE